jgi:F-type H+-transporting ATPase subunit b
MSILDSLGINIGAVLWHFFNFLLLIWVLQKYMYKPVLKMLDDRATRIRESLAQAEAVREETARLESESRSILDEARRQGQELLALANQNSERIVSEARQAAQQEAERLVERARSEMTRERDQAFAELREQVADLTVAAASRLINRSLDDQAHRALVREFLTADLSDVNERRS